MTGFESKRQMSQGKLDDDDDKQVYSETLLIVYQKGFADGKRAANAMHEVARLGQEIEQEPTPWRDMMVVSLVREGINKHRARELADHFAAQPEQWDKPSASFNEWWDSYHIDPSNPFAEGTAAYWAWAGWKAAQRPWQSLTEQDMPSGEDPIFDHQYFIAGMVYAAKVLQEKNT